MMEFEFEPFAWDLAMKQMKPGDSLPAVRCLALLEDMSDDEAEVAKISEIPEEKVTQYLSLIPEVCSLDAPVGEDGTLQLLLEDAQSPEPMEQLVRQELKDSMEVLLAELNPRQQQVLRLRFGMADGNRYSFEKIGTMLGVSKERARQIEKQAMDKLYRLGRDLGLEEFLE